MKSFTESDGSSAVAVRAFPTQAAFPSEKLFRGFLPLAAPIPPLALRGGKPRVLRLRYRRGENIEDAGVLPRSSHSAEPVVKALWVCAPELGDSVDAHPLEIAANGWADGDQVFQLTSV